MMKILLTFVTVLLLGSAAGAQTVPHIHIDHGELHYLWSAGGGLSADGFTLNCTQTGSSPVTLHIADGAARSIAISDIPLTTGLWGCTVLATNGVQTSGNSNAAAVVVEDFLPAPTNLTVQ